MHVLLILPGVGPPLTSLAMFEEAESNLAKVIPPVSELRTSYSTRRDY